MVVVAAALISASVGDGLNISTCLRREIALSYEIFSICYWRVNTRPSEGSYPSWKTARTFSNALVWSPIALFRAVLAVGPSMFAALTIRSKVVANSCAVSGPWRY